MMCANNWVHHGLKVEFLCLHITISSSSPSSSSLCKLTEIIEHIRYWLDIFYRVGFKIKSIHAVIVHVIYGIICFQLTSFSCDRCENICIYGIIIIKSEVWIISHRRLCHKTMVCAVYLAIFSCSFFLQRLWSKVYYFHTGPIMRCFDVSFDVSLHKLLNKQWTGTWIKMCWWSFDVAV